MAFGLLIAFAAGLLVLAIPFLTVAGVLIGTLCLGGLVSQLVITSKEPTREPERGAERAEASGKA